MQHNEKVDMNVYNLGFIDDQALYQLVLNTVIPELEAYGSDMIKTLFGVSFASYQGFEGFDHGDR